MKILVAGGSSLTMHIISYLISQGHRIMLIDPDLMVCEQVADMLRHPVIHGNGWSAKALKEAHAEKYDLIIAATGQDADNLVTCEMAENYAIHRSIAMVDNPGHASVFHQLGIDQVLCTAQMINSMISQAIVTGSNGQSTPIGDSILSTSH
jgi:trk system potassium uptake protein TrkA